MLALKILGTVILLTGSVLSDEEIPGSLVIPASQYFEGNDGPWSTFDVRVGTPEQYIRVLVSTASPFPLIPFSEQACSTDVFDTVPPDCAVSRGNLFKPNDSSTWEDLGIYGINQNGVGLQANLGYDQRVQFGQENIGVGLNGPEFDAHIVGGIATPSPFYLGIFGLNNQPFNLTTLGNHPSSSFLTRLKDSRKIPSLSWSYTAGAKYRLKQVYGQLIFSGYDTSRFKENPVSFSMAEDVTRDLVVALQSISYSGSKSATLLSNSIDIMIDSTDPNLWLPEDVCDKFEAVFGLTLDEKSGLYLVNETHRNTLLDSNAEVSFRLSDVKSGGDTVTVVLPYAAFDLAAKNPLVQSTSHYFPLKRASNSTQYTLGRTFLQEAYLSVDYERKVFNVSACVWKPGAQENIVTITSKDGPNSHVGAGGNNGGSSTRLSGGAIAGIVVACVTFALLAIAGLAVCMLRKRRKWIAKGFRTSSKAPPPDDDILKGPVFNSPLTQHASGSTPGDSSVPFSADEVSANRSRSTMEQIRPSSGVPLVVESVVGGGTVELDGDGTAVRPNTELDGNELTVPKPLPSVAENASGVFELPGSDITGAGSRGLSPKRPKEALPVGLRDFTPHSTRGNHSPPSPLTSTTDGRVDFGKHNVDGSDVSPSSPAFSRGSRAF